MNIEKIKQEYQKKVWALTKAGIKQPKEWNLILDLIEKLEEKE